MARAGGTDPRSSRNTAYAYSGICTIHCQSGTTLFTGDIPNRDLTFITLSRLISKFAEGRATRLRDATGKPPSGRRRVLFRNQWSSCPAPRTHMISRLQRTATGFEIVRTRLSEALPWVVSFLRGVSILVNCAHRRCHLLPGFNARHQANARKTAWVRTDSL